MNVSACNNRNVTIFPCTTLNELTSAPDVTFILFTTHAQFWIKITITRALDKRRPPWQRQLITPIMPWFPMVSQHGNPEQLFPVSLQSSAGMAGFLIVQSAWWFAGGTPCHQWNFYIDGLCIQCWRSKSWKLDHSAWIIQAPWWSESLPKSNHLFPLPTQTPL